MHSELAVQIIPQMYPEPTRVQYKYITLSVLLKYSTIMPCHHAYIYACTHTQMHTRRHRHTVHTCTYCMHGCTQTYIQRDRHTPVEYGGSHWGSSSMYKLVSACQEGLVWMSNSPFCVAALPVCYP